MKAHAAPLEAASRQAPVINMGDNAWVLASAALVLMMTAPGLILFYGGLVRRKNVLGTMMQSLVLMALVSVLWMVYGYSMAFGEGNWFFGNPFQYFMLNGVGAAPNPAYAPTVPQESFMLFQMMFAIITPALISGAVAERMRFKAYVLFMVLWVTFIYFPLCHMVWGKGGLFNWSLGGRYPVLDFAGGMVVHVSSGVSALVCALVLGKRIGFPAEPMPPHNVVLSLIGAGLLWVGWFGFNAGSARQRRRAGQQRVCGDAFFGGGGRAGMGRDRMAPQGQAQRARGRFRHGRGPGHDHARLGFCDDPGGILNRIDRRGGLLHGGEQTQKRRCGYDDSLDVFGVHAVGSATGLLMVGLFASADVNAAIGNTFTAGGKVVSLAGSPAQLGNQFRGLIFTVVLAAAGTFVILKVVSALGGLRVTPEEEDSGLDLSEHGESAYND